FHDVSLTLGMFALFQMEFSLQSIAAILEIIGYSLNDTIVIYDRIRENLKKYRKMPLPELLDLSVNETLARTVMTSLTLLIALVPLLLFGPPSLFSMVAAITLGLFVGTYSSVYMAAPILIWLGVDSHSFVPQESAADRQEKAARGEVCARSDLRNAARVPRRARASRSVRPSPPRARAPAGRRTVGAAPRRAIRCRGGRRIPRPGRSRVRARRRRRRSRAVCRRQVPPPTRWRGLPSSTAAPWRPPPRARQEACRDRPSRGSERG